MKSLQEYLNNIYLNEAFNEVDAEIVCEKLSDPKLVKLAKSLRNFGSKNKGKFYNNSFSGIFGRYNIEWDKITESDWDYYKAGDKAGLKEVRRIISNSKNWFDGIALLVSGEGEDEEIRYLVSYKTLVDFKNKTWDGKDSEPKRGTYDKQYEITGLLEQRDKEGNYKYSLYILDLTNRTQAVNKKRGERSQAQENIVLQGDENYYKKLAAENVERYKKIIAKAKAEKDAADDKTIVNAQEVLNDLMEVSAKIAADPIKYADISFKVYMLITDSYSKSANGKNLINLIGEYVYASKEVRAGSSSEYTRRNFKATKETIAKMTERIKKELDDVKAKL